MKNMNIEKCLELLEYKIWLIEFELRNVDISDKRYIYLNEQHAHLTKLKPKLIKRAKL